MTSGAEAPAESLKLRLTLRVSCCFTRNGPPPRRKAHHVEALPDLATLSDDELQAADRRARPKEEQEVSYRRRILHGQIDILRAELARGCSAAGGKSILEQVDVDRLADILAGKARPSPPSDRVMPRLLPGVRLPEPGGRQLLRQVRHAARQGGAGAETTMTFTPEEGDEDGTLRSRSSAPRARRSSSAPAAAARARLRADRRAHDDRPLARLRRLPRRRHGLAQARGARAAGRRASRSRTRAASTARSSTAGGSSRAELEDGDELQIGKYRLTFLRNERLPRPQPAERQPRCSRSARSAGACRTSSRTSRSRRSATSRTRACSRRGARRAATGSSARRTSSGSRRSCACSATSSCRCA